MNKQLGERFDINSADSEPAAPQKSVELPGTPMTRREVLSFLGASVTMAGVGGSAYAQATPKKGGVLKVSGAANPSSLDPATGGAGSDHTYLWTMFDTLVEWDYETLNVKPGMASALPAKYSRGLGMPRKSR